MDTDYHRPLYSRASALRFFIHIINRPKLVVTPHLEIEQVSVGEKFEAYRWKIWFHVLNDGKNSAKLSVFEVSAKCEPGQRWQAPSQREGRANFPPIGYRGATRFDWVSENLDIRYSGDDYEYYMHGQRTPMWIFKKGDQGAVTPLNLISGAIYGDESLKKEFTMMLYVTSNPKEPFRLKPLRGLSETPS